MTDGGARLGMQLSGHRRHRRRLRRLASCGRATIIGIFLLDRPIAHRTGATVGMIQARLAPPPRRERLAAHRTTSPIPSGEHRHKRLRDQWDDFLVRMARAGAGAVAAAGGYLGGTRRAAHRNRRRRVTPEQRRRPATACYADEDRHAAQGRR
ncbi:MAG: hypothetical protein R3A10_13940 [Caldilineaceae bacterium]